MVKNFLREIPFGFLIITFSIYGFCALLLTPFGGHAVVNNKDDLVLTTNNNIYKTGDILSLKKPKEGASFVQVINVKEGISGSFYEVQNYLEKDTKKYLIASNSVSGKAIYLIKEGGRVLNFGQTTKGLAFFTGIPIMFIVFELALRELEKISRKHRSKRPAKIISKKAYQPMGVNYPGASFQSLINTINNNSNEVFNRLTSSYRQTRKQNEKFATFS